MAEAHTRVGVGAAVLCGAWLRFGALGRESLWLDELFTVRVATRARWSEMVEDLARDVHPLGYFSLVRLLGGAELSDAGWRMPSAAAGVATILGAAWLAFRLLGARAAVVAAWVVSTMPGLVLLDREARPNALLAALGMWLCAAVLTGRRGWGVALLVAALAHVHLFGLLVVAAVVAVGLLAPDGRRALLLSSAAGLATLVPWLGPLQGQVTAFMDASWYTPPSGDSFGWVLGELFDERLGLGVLAIVGVGLAAARREAAAEQLVLLVVALLLGTIVVPQLVSYGFAPILRPRSAVVVLPALGVLVAVGFAGHGRSGLALALLTVVTQGVLSWRVTRHEARMEQWREAAQMVRKDAAADVPIVANHVQLWRRYLPDAALLDAADPGLHAAPRAWVLLGHDLDLPPAVQALTTGAAPRQTDLRSVRVLELGPVAMPLPFVATPDTPASVDGARVELWANGTVETGELRVRGTCAIEVEGSEDPAGTAHAVVQVALVEGDRTVIDAPITLLPTVTATQTRSTDGPLSGEPGVRPMRVRLTFVNDAVVDGKDRNVHIVAVRLRCT